MNIEVRDARVEDAEGIAELLYKTWLATYPSEEAGITTDDIKELFKKWLNEAGLEKRRESIRNKPDNLKYLVAENNGKIIGTCKMFRKEDKNQLRMIYVLPEYQGQGIGRKMWEIVLPFANPEKDTYVEVAEYNNGAIAFYHRLGFRETGRKFKDERFKMKSGVYINEIEMILKK